MRLLSVATGLLLLISSVVAQKSTPNSLDDLRFLIGEWEGVGAGGPGAGKGVFSFAFGLQNKAIVRKNYAEYPPAADRPAVRHDDLMVIYFDRASNQILANYFDSEGQQITYKVTPSFGPRGRDVFERALCVETSLSADLQEGSRRGL